MRNKVLVITFILCLALIGTYILIIKDKPEVSQLENRRLSQVRKLTINSWLTKEFQESVEITIADHYVGRSKWIKYYNKFEMDLNDLGSKLITTLYNENSIRQGVQAVNSNISVVLIEDSQYLIRSLYTYDQIVEKVINHNIDIVNNLNKKYAEVDFYVYIPVMAHETNIVDTDKTAEMYLNLFQKLDIPYKQLDVRNTLDFQEIYYKTDHHWNHEGAYNGYLDIISILFNGEEKANSPIGKDCYNDISFYGSHSRRIAHSLEIEADRLCKYRFDLPEYKIHIDGSTVAEYGNLIKYINGDIDKTKGFDHYNFLYQSRRAEIIFETDREDYENILIISDSMSNPIRDIIAMHFNKSVFINLDMYQTYKGEFDIKQYIEDYKVNKVLIMVALGNYFPEGELKYLIQSQ